MSGNPIRAGARTERVMGKWIGLALVFSAGLVIAAVAGAADTKLTGVVGPGFTISLVDAQGQSVTRLPAGEVDITVDDRGNEHNFHLRGPGVDFSTGVEEVGQRTFTVTLRDGSYTFVCDPHAGQMAGAFQAGTGGTTTPPPTTSPPPTTTTPSPTRPAASAPVGSTLNLTVGPGFTISLRTRAGKKVTVLRPGSYTVVARDRSSAHNARLRGAGASKATGVGFVGTRTWRVTLRNGQLVIQCDPHKTSMRATVRVV